MFEKDTVKKLAQLSRLLLTEAECEDLAGELGSIVAYVSEIENVVGERAGDAGAPLSKNVLRDDRNAHEPGMYTQKILDAAPDKERGFFKVKKIL